MSTISTKTVLGSLSEGEQAITLAIELGGVLVPLAKGLVREIKQIATGKETVTYQVLLETDGKELDAAHQLAVDDLAAINAELTKLGLKPITAS